jgi:predicted site-specific integrase-resolvase
MPPTPNESYLMKPGEVMDLLRIGRTTLHEWRTRGDLDAIRHTPKGPWRYPASQGVIQAALAAVRGLR